MIKYKPVKTKVVTESRCILLQCDLCGSVADDPYNESWTWGGVGIAHGTLKSSIWIDGEQLGDHKHLCPDCAARLMGLLSDDAFKKLVLGEKK